MRYKKIKEIYTENYRGEIYVKKENTKQKLLRIEFENDLIYMEGTKKQILVKLKELEMLIKELLKEENKKGGNYE